MEHIDAGKLDERVLVLALQETAENVWRWVEIRKTWASVEQSTRRNNWSVHGIGATGVKLTMRRQALSNHWPQRAKKTSEKSEVFCFI